MLGRRNCQRFLQQYFCVPVEAENPIIEAGYGKLDQNFLNLFLSESGKQLPLIPDFRISDDQKQILKPVVEDEFNYPSVSLKYLLEVETKMQKRFEVVLNNMLNGEDPGSTAATISPTVQRIRKKSWFSRKIVGSLLDLGKNTAMSLGKRAGKNIAAEKFIDAVITDMEKRGLLNVDC